MMRKAKRWPRYRRRVFGYDNVEITCGGWVAIARKRQIKRPKRQWSGASSSCGPQAPA